MITLAKNNVDCICRIFTHFHTPPQMPLTVNVEWKSCKLFLRRFLEYWRGHTTFQIHLGVQFVVTLCCKRDKYWLEKIGHYKFSYQDQTQYLETIGGKVIDLTKGDTQKPL